ncbi:MAG: hypothetical protein ABJO09_05945 [Hyphomicrobiales bacterium]
MGRTFVGIGFGAIQTGLFLREAQASGAFDRFVVAMRRPELVDAVNRTGTVVVNIALPDGIKVETYQRIEARCLQNPDDLADLKHDLVSAEEISVAVSSVDDYVTKAPNSLHILLAEAVLEKLKIGAVKSLIYSSENHNAAASLLEDAIMSAIPPAHKTSALNVFQTADTVIGKMSRVITDRDEIDRAGLTTSSPDGTRAFLVEAFNRILMSKVDLERTSGRGISQFIERADLKPYEHAKIHGHNATHAGFAYVGNVLGLEWMADVAAVPDVRNFFRDAFLEESGAALIRLHRGNDPLFSNEGYQTYVDDLLERMANPWLRDTCARIGRDVVRKLGWDDRLIGTVRLIHGQGLSANRYGFAALAGFEVLRKPTTEMIEPWMAAGASTEEASRMADWLNELLPDYQAWRDHLKNLPIPTNTFEFPPQDKSN